MSVEPAFPGFQQKQSKIQLLQVAAPVQMNQANSQAVTSTTWSTTSGSIVTASIDISNSVQGLARTATITNPINSAQEQQQVALAYFQLPSGENVEGQVGRIINVDGAAGVSWPGASTVDVKGVAELQSASAIEEQDFAVACLQDIQEQDGHAQQIISNDRSLHRRELSPNAINSVQQQQALVYFQQSKDQNAQGQVSQIIDVDGAAAVSWPGASTADVQGVAEIQPANAIQEQDFTVACLQDVQVQDVQAQQIISNDQTLHSHELSSNSLAAWAITSTLIHLQMPLFSCIQTVDAGAQESSIHLQKDSSDTEKWKVLASATNPTTVSTPIQYSQVSESVAHNLVIAVISTASTSAESQSSSALNALRMRMRIEACPCPNCDYQDENFLLNIEKGQVIASATNPATVSTLIQHSQVSESVAPNLVIGVTSTASTSAESQSSNSPLNASLLRTRNACPCLNCNDQDKKNKKSKKKEHPCHAPGCTKVYCKTSNLIAHYRCHTGERPFVCSWMSCGKNFLRLHHLESHLRTHTGEKHFQCYECFRRFSSKHSLSRHFNSYHNKGTWQLPT